MTRNIRESRCVTDQKRARSSVKRSSKRLYALIIITPPSSWDVIALADMMISQSPGAFSYPQIVILDKSE